MKNRIYKIKDKILVRGNENELTEDEVLVKEENGSVVLKERVNGEVINVVVGGATLKYIDVTNIDSSFITVLRAVSLLDKNILGEPGSLTVLITPGRTFTEAPDIVLTAVAIDFETITQLYPYGAELEPMPIREILIKLGITQEQLNSLSYISEEQFYDLTLPTE